MLMRILLAPLIAALLLTSPALAQDFIEGFGDFLEEMLPQRQGGTGAPRPAPAEPVAASQPTPVSQRPSTASAEKDASATPPLPRPRPEAPAQEDMDAPDAPAPAARPATPGPEPEAAPDRVYQTACPAVLSGRVTGEMLEPIAEGLCRARSPLSVTALAVNGRSIALSSPVSSNCAMAGALAEWVEAVDGYARAALGSGVAEVVTGTSYMCRNRYSAADGFVSEHGFANALDVVGFTLDNGETITVDTDWARAGAPEGRLLRLAHGAACGRFTTVLGPEANADHKDHFHLDLGCHGQSCTAQICE